jgi:hypothetical protein
LTKLRRPIGTSQFGQILPLVMSVRVPLLHAGLLVPE